MDNANKLVLRALDVAAVAALGVCYVQLLRFVLSSLNPLVPESASSLEKMALTGTAALISGGAMFLANSVIARQNHLALGLACSVWAYVHFYIIKLWPNPMQVILVFMTGYSAFAFCAFVVAPIVAGIVLNKKTPLGGMAQLLTEWKQRGGV